MAPGRGDLRGARRRPKGGPQRLRRAGRACYDDNKCHKTVGRREGDKFVVT